MIMPVGVPNWGDGVQIPSVGVVIVGAFNLQSPCTSSSSPENIRSSLQSPEYWPKGQRPASVSVVIIVKKWLGQQQHHIQDDLEHIGLLSYAANQSIDCAVESSRRYRHSTYVAQNGRENG
jgi:hypothetical protein